MFKRLPKIVCIVFIGAALGLSVLGMYPNDTLESDMLYYITMIITAIVIVAIFIKIFKRLQKTVYIVFMCIATGLSVFGMSLNGMLGPVMFYIAIMIMSVVVFAAFCISGLALIMSNYKCGNCDTRVFKSDDKCYRCGRTLVNKL